jgi:spore maturation protein SpmA
MLNVIFVILVLSSLLLAAWAGGMEALTSAILDSAKSAVELAIKLIGVMALFLGLMRVAEEGGLLRILSRALSPVLRRLFPTIPDGHPAFSAMILNIASNVLGLGNAATPFGIKAMQELDSLNTRKGTATNAMVLFLAINTSGLALLPSGVMGIRAALDSADPAGIMFPTWFATGSATVVGILAATFLSRLPRYRKSEPPPAAASDRGSGEDADGADAETTDDRFVGGRPKLGGLLALGVVVAYLAAMVVYLVGTDSQITLFERMKHVLSFWLLPAVVGGLVLFGWSRGVKVYEALVEGAKEGWNVAVRIIPYLVAILVAVGMFRASGGIDALARLIGPITNVIGMPAEALPVAIMRPLSGSGALGVMTEIMQHNGPDSFLGYMVSTMYGSTETTFYVLAVYFGAIGIKRTRHALPACLAADCAGILAGVLIVNLLFG